jgi:outer membrane protein assembly factor BamB
MNFKKYSLVLTIALLMTTLTVATAYIIAVPTSAQTTTDWPMFMGNPAHTGVSPAVPFDSWMVGWKFEAEAGVRSSPSIVNGKVYFGSDDTYLYCLDLNDGSLEWKYETRAGILSSPCVVGGNVYFGGFDKYVYCLTASTGTKVWEYKTGGYIYSSPVVVGGKVYIGSSDRNLYCLNAADGSLIWNYTAMDSIYNVSPAVVDGYVYIGSCGNDLLKLNATDGTLVWTFMIESEGFYHSSPCVVDGVVYIGSDDSGMYAVNATTAEQVWYYIPNPEYIQKTYGLGVQNSYMESTACVKDGKVWAAFAHAMHCLDAATGEILWVVKLGNVAYGGTTWADGRVYTGSEDQYIYQFDAETGERLQSYVALPRGAWKTAMAVVDGKLVAGCSNRWVYCFVQGIQTAISRWVSPTVITLGESVNVGGGILPAVSGATVTLTYVAPNLTETTQTVMTATDGTYSSSFTPTVQTGLWELIAKWSGSTTHGEAEAFPQFFTVEPVSPGKMATTISCSATPTTAKVGGTITVSGNISPAVGGMLVTITYTKPDATTFTTTSSSGTGGAYVHTFKPDTSGTWNVKASWTGSKSYSAAASSAANVTVTEEAGAAAAAGIAPEIIYGVVGVVIIAIVAVVAYMFMKKKK